MKTLLALGLFLVTTLSFASATYTCSVRLSKLEFKQDGSFSTLTIKDAQSGMNVFISSNPEINHDNAQTEFTFVSHLNHELKLKFKTDALVKEEKVLFGLADGHTGLDFVNNSSIKCIKK